MGRGRKILSLAMCGVLALTLGACGGGAKSGDDSSSSTLFEKDASSSQANSEKNLSKYADGVDDIGYVKDLTNHIDAFTYEEPQGWEKETRDHYILYKKMDGKDVQAVIVIAQRNEDHAKSGGDMSRLGDNAYASYMTDFLQSGECYVNESNRKNALISLPLQKNECYVDGCSGRSEDYYVTVNPIFGDGEGSMLALGGADAELLTGIVSPRGSYSNYRADFERLEASIHVAADQLDKIKQLMGTAPKVGNSFADKSLYKDDSQSATTSQNTTGNVSEQYGAGMYKVGTDIPAGEYKLTASSGTSGYWQVTNSSDADADIVGNDNFDGSAYVTVKDGQYLKLQNCTAVATGK